MDVKKRTVIQAPALESVAKACDGVRAAAFSPDGSRLVIGCFFSGQVSAWDTRTWREVSSANLAAENIQTLMVTNDDKTVVAGTAPNPVGSDGSAQAVWFLRLSDLHPESSPVAAHPGGVLSIVQGGQRIFTSGWDGTIRSWTLVGHPTGHVTSVNGHAYELAYDQQANLLIASASDGLTFYNPATLQPVSPAFGVGDPANGPQVVVGLTVSPDGKYVAGVLSASYGGSGVAEWTVNEASWVAETCAKAGNLTGAEWQQYGSPAVSPLTVCPSTQPVSPKPAVSPDVGTAPGLTSVTAAAIPEHTGTCADLTSSSILKCAITGDGYAWTIERAKLGVQATVYADEKTAWQPILATSKTMEVWEADVVPFSTEGNQPALAVWQVNSADGSGEDLSVVESGQVAWDQEGSFEGIQAQRDGLRIWLGVYGPTDAVCCPSGHMSELLTQPPSGGWAIQDQQAVTESSIPRMTAYY